MRWAGPLLLCSLLTAGLIPLDAPLPPPGTAGAPLRTLDQAEEARFLRGRLLFDKDFMRADGLGPHFNGDSCRACHQDPVVGGAGGIDVQVQRPAGEPPETGELAQTHSLPGVPREEIPAGIAFVEERASPTLLGLGLVETIAEQTILDGQDPGDGDADGIIGVAHMLPGNLVGRFGWKGNFPDLRAFLRDALGNEMGITVPDTGNPAGITSDNDAVADPEITPADINDMLFFMQLLDFAPKGQATAESQLGEALFLSVGCAKCHTPVMDGVELYSNLLLHDVLGPGFQGVTQGQATSGLYRTAPLRGLSDTAPYFHDGRSETIDDAIRRHQAEAEAVRAAYEALTDAQRAAVLAFLERL